MANWSHNGMAHSGNNFNYLPQFKLILNKFENVVSYLLLKIRTELDV